MFSMSHSGWMSAALCAALVLATNDTRNSVATLTGQVATQAEKQLALRIAKDTDGVRHVADPIQVAKR